MQSSFSFWLYLKPKTETILHAIVPVCLPSNHLTSQAVWDVPLHAITGSNISCTSLRRRIYNIFAD